MRPAPVDEALATLMRAAAQGQESRSGGHLAYIPGSGLLTAAVGDLLATVRQPLHRRAPSPRRGRLPSRPGCCGGCASCSACPDGAQAVLLSGGSMANLTALVAAREHHAPGEPQRATVYVGEQAHASVRKAARTIGILPGHVRVCPSVDGIRLDSASACAC